jgi:hypothetical protein
MLETAVTRSIKAGSTALSPRKARDTVLGLTPAARATSLSVTRPVARVLFEGNGVVDKG